MPVDSLRILFVGAHIEALRPFEHLIAGSQRIVGLFALEPDSLSKMSGGVDLSRLACAARIPVMKGRNVNDPEAIEWIREEAPHVLLAAGWTPLAKSQLVA